MRRGPVLIFVALLTTACEYEHRPIGPDPLSPPIGAADPRINFYDKNAWQVSIGSRLFTWYGCGACHAGDARPGMNLHGGREVAFETIYGAIANGGPGMPGYADKAPSESIWQMTAYVRSLRALKETKRNRSDLDGKGEPTGRTWAGAAR